MNKNYNNPELGYYEEENDEISIDIVGICIKMLKKWKSICLIGFIFAAIGVIVALNTTKMYKVTATLAPESQRTTNSNLSGIASILGINNATMNSVDALNISFFPEICQSNPFLTDLFDVQIHYNQSIEEKLAGKPEKVTSVFEHVAELDKPLSKRKQKLIEKAKANGTYFEYDDSVIIISSLTPNQKKAISFLSKNITADVDKSNGFTKISVKMDDPRMATELTDTVVARLQEYVIAYRTQKVQGDIEYYSKVAEEARQNMVNAQNAYAASMDYNRSVILQSVSSQRERLKNEANLASQIYNQLAQQLELSKAKLQEEKPVYAIIQPASQPTDSITSRKKIVLIWGFIGGFLACAWYGIGLDICKFLFSSIKERWNEDEEATEETKEA